MSVVLFLTLLCPWSALAAFNLSFRFLSKFINSEFPASQFYRYTHRTAGLDLLLGKLVPRKEKDDSGEKGGFRGGGGG